MRMAILPVGRRSTSQRDHLALRGALRSSDRTSAATALMSRCKSGERGEMDNQTRRALARSVRQSTGHSIIYRHAESVRSGRARKPNGWTARGLARAVRKKHDTPDLVPTESFLREIGVIQ